VIAVMGLTPERARQIMFTSPYADTQLAVYGPKALAVSSADMLGNSRSRHQGSTMEIGLSAMNPKAQIMRTEDDATSATAYLSGQTELFDTNSLLIPDLKKRNPTKEFEVKFTIRRSPAHIGVRMGEHNLVRWLDSFIFFNTMNGEIDRLAPEVPGHTVSPRCPRSEATTMTEIEWSRLKASEIKALAARNAVVIVRSAPPSSTARTCQAWSTGAASTKCRIARPGSWRRPCPSWSHPRSPTACRSTTCRSPARSRSNYATCTRDQMRRHLRDPHGFNAVVAQRSWRQHDALRTLVRA